MSEDIFEIGKIVNTHGIKGELKIIPYTDDIDQFNDFNYLYVDRNKEKLDIEYVRFHKNFVLVKFHGIKDMNMAENLKNKPVYIKRSKKVLPENTYYIVDLLGTKVYTNDEYLGEVDDVFPTGSNDVYVVKNMENGKQILLPAIKEVIKEVNIDEKYMKVNIIEGLID